MILHVGKFEAIAMTNHLFMVNFQEARKTRVKIWS